MSTSDTFAATPGTSVPTPNNAVVRSQVILQRLGLTYVGVLLPSVGLMAVVFAALTFSDGDVRTGGGLLVLGLGLLYSIWPLLRRAQLPYLATLGAAGLRLEPRDRTAQMGKTTQTVPLADISGFSEQVISRTNDEARQLVLFLTDGRKLRLTDRPAKFRLAGPGEDELVTVVALGQALRPLLAGRGLPPEALHRPNFYQSGFGKVLAWLCWACVAAGVVLLVVPDVPWTTGLRLLTFSSIYLGLYSRNRKLAA